MERQIPKSGEFYRHFKNKLYQIVTIATHSETGKSLVIYQALYGDFKVYARPLEMFLSPVDHEKYPEVSQKFRFEQVIPGKNEEEIREVVPISIKKMEEAEEEKVPEEFFKEQNPLLEFLDARNHEERLNVLFKYRESISETMLDSMSLSMDCVLIGEGPEEKYEELVKILKTKIQYEKQSRLK